MTDEGAPVRVDALGEFPLIERLVARLRRPGPDVVLGPGDDVAAVRVGDDRLLLMTCDVQVSGTHFVPERCDPFRLGRKAAAINLSDIAAVGGRPTYFLVSLVLPRSTEVRFLEALYDGLAEEATTWDAAVVGGNVSQGEQLVIDLALLGEARERQLLRRDGARAGDRLLVTGALGAAAAGLHLTLHPELNVSEAARREAVDAFETPVPRLREARALVDAGGVSSAIDLSDGLAADVAHLCERSGVGVRLAAAAVPVAPSAVAVAAAAGRDPLQWALGGGEDYELAFTAPAPRVDALVAAVAAAGGAPAVVVGEIVSADRGRSVRLADGSLRPLEPSGWRHF